LDCNIRGFLQTLYKGFKQASMNFAMPRCPYCENEFSGKDVQVEEIEPYGYNTKYALIYCPQGDCAKVLGVIEVKPLE
jgi:hypothetical protein